MRTTGRVAIVYAACHHCPAQGGAVGAWLQANGPFRGFPFTVAGFTLFASYLGGEGPIYRAVEEFSLQYPAFRDRVRQIINTVRREEGLPEV